MGYAMICCMIVVALIAGMSNLTKPDASAIPPTQATSNADAVTPLGAVVSMETVSNGIRVSTDAGLFRTEGVAKAATGEAATLYTHMQGGVRHILCTGPAGAAVTDCHAVRNDG